MKFFGVVSVLILTAGLLGATAVSQVCTVGGGGLFAMDHGALGYPAPPAGCSYVTNLTPSFQTTLLLTSLPLTTSAMVSLQAIPDTIMTLTVNGSLVGSTTSGQFQNFNVLGFLGSPGVETILLGFTQACNCNVNNIVGGYAKVVFTSDSVGQNPVPEPATLPLLMLAMAVAGVFLPNLRKQSK